MTDTNAYLAMIHAEIDADPTLTEREKLKAKAAATRDYREMIGEPVTKREIQHKNRSGFWATFGQQFARSLARSFFGGSGSKSRGRSIKSGPVRFPKSFSKPARKPRLARKQGW